MNVSPRKVSSDTSRPNQPAITLNEQSLRIHNGLALQNIQEATACDHDKQMAFHSHSSRHAFLDFELNIHLKTRILFESEIDNLGPDRD